VSYFVIELCSIGGCPLEEASEHCSLNNKIIAILFSHILCSGYISSHICIWVSFAGLEHNKWYQSTFQGRWDLHFLAKKKKARDVFRRL
jgi:hypothetical protein